jgi:hypothetical protein
MTEHKPSIADTLNVSAYDESFSANADRAAAKVPVLGTAYTGKSIAEHAQEGIDDFGDLAAATGELAADGAEFVGSAAMDATFFAMDPIGWLVSNGLEILLELVQPLQDALHQVSGDGPAIGHASDNFVTIARGFVELADDFEKTGDTALKDWVDDAGEAARAALGDFSAGIRGIGSSAGSVAEVLQMWSMVMVVIEEVIKAIISELVAWLITLWLPALATSVISAGASVATAMTASVQKAATVFQKVAKHLGVFGKLLDKFMEFLKKLADEFKIFVRKFREGVKKGERKTPHFFTKATEDIPSRRMRVKDEDVKAADKVGALFAGMGIKAGIGAGMGAAGEVSAELNENGPLFDKSDIGDKNAADTRENLDI